MTISATFLRHSSRFKTYAAFCARHTEIVAAIKEVKSTSRLFHEFLEARNPNQQHSSTFESYLIKPIQVRCKYFLMYWSQNFHCLVYSIYIATLRCVLLYLLYYNFSKNLYYENKLLLFVFAIWEIFFISKRKELFI